MIPAPSIGLRLEATRGITPRDQERLRAGKRFGALWIEELTYDCRAFDLRLTYPPDRKPVIAEPKGTEILAVVQRILDLAIAEATVRTGWRVLAVSTELEWRP